MRHFNISRNAFSCQAWQFRSLIALLLGFFAFLLFALPAEAKIKAQGEKIIQSEYRLVMFPGEVKTVKVGFKNTSSNLIWRRDSRNYASLYAVGPRYRKSAFAHKSWVNKNQVAKITSKQAKPGEIAYVEFNLRAPDAVGDYIEDFGLALENLAWVEGAIVEMQIKVVPKEDIAKQSRKLSQNLASPHQTQLLLQSHRSLTLKSNETIAVRFGFKNTGKQIWNNRGMKPLGSVRIAGEDALNNPVPAAGSSEPNAALAWFDSEIPVYYKNESVKPGELGFIDLTLRAPRQGGKYALRLALIVDDQIVNGGEVELPVEIIEEAPAVEPAGESAPFTPVMEEPSIRIGLQKTRDPILITADGPYEIRDSDGNPLGIVPAGIVAIARFNFSAKVYSVETGEISYSGPNYLRFLPTAPGTIFEIKSLARHPFFSSEINDNNYRGALEIRLSEVGNLWIINELKLEEYLRGLAEARDSAPLNFQKAQAVAARSFAYYNIANGGKYKKGYFDLTWTPDDQVYRGYNSELRMPNLARGVEETRGTFVTYDGKVVTTPYFARSRGYTRRWTEVWGGSDKPWLQSVPAPADEGAPARGHGVGLSQNDAIWRADQGWSYEEILKYYYQGIELKKLY